MFKFISIAMGGAIGALLRYAASGVVYRWFGETFPWGTFAVNMCGSLAIGFLWGISESVVVSTNVKLFVFIGFLGAFTTFSTVTLETMHLCRDSEYWLAFGNIAGSVVAGMVCVFAGFWLSRCLH
jgi:CrcB protein